LRRFKEREDNYYQSILEYKRDTPNPFAMDIKVQGETGDWMLGPEG